MLGQAEETVALVRPGAIEESHLTMEEKMKRVLIVEDQMSPETLAALQAKYDVTLVENCWSAVVSLVEEDWDHIILDMNFPLRTDGGNVESLKMGMDARREQMFDAITDEAVHELPRGERGAQRKHTTFGLSLESRLGNGAVLAAMLKTVRYGTFFSESARHTPVTMFTNDYGHSMISIWALVSIGVLSSEAVVEAAMDESRQHQDQNYNGESFNISNDQTFAIGRKDKLEYWLALLETICR